MVEKSECSTWFKPAENQIQMSCTWCKETLQLGPLGIKSLKLYDKSEKNKAAIKTQPILSYIRSGSFKIRPQRDTCNVQILHLAAIGQHLNLSLHWKPRYGYYTLWLITSHKTATMALVRRLQQFSLTLTFLTPLPVGRTRTRTSCDLDWATSLKETDLTATV